MEMFLVVALCALVAAPGILCNTKNGADMKKRQTMMVWGAITGYIGFWTVLCFSGVLSGFGEYFEYIGDLISFKEGVIKTLFEILYNVFPVIVGGGIGYFTQNTSLGSIIWRMVKIVIMSVITSFIIGFLEAIALEPTLAWGILAIIAILAGLGIKEPGWILFIFK